ncbi:MAG TPA: penicillin acylase family protein [Thermoanaerobaculia bacterium]|jgi:penicillin amidase|nr:penicillin acylase family protein [Thermoanaerobaculia bacterium]
MRERRVRSLLFAALLCLALPGASQTDLSGRARAALAQTSGRLAVSGLSRPVTVLRDPWGIPHIYAETQDDLFFAQGFVAAQDRLFQMEVWRRTAEGRLAEILGPKYVERDRVARLLRYRGDLEAEYASYAPDAKGIVEAFVRGVNAYIETVRDRPPVEFELAGFRPEPWTPEVCLSRLASLGVTGYAAYEVGRALLIRDMGAEAAADLFPPDPAAPLQVPEGLDLAMVDPRVLAGFFAAGGPVSFEKEGSNNWVVDGSLSATGRPLLANDPHRSIGVPSLRWMVHLVAPGWNVIGAGEPALPGVAAGHNDRVGFGFTIVGIDQQDLYVEEVNPESPNEVRSRGRWVPMRIERETIRVQGGEPVAVDLKFTEHGPVVFEDPARHRAWALRWVGSEPGTAGYLGSLSLDRARSWPEFLKALERWKVPSENLVYADVEGNIGWKVAGLTPLRKGWNGLLPVPGDGRYEWQGFLPAAELPQDFNPGRHFLATANHNILPPGYPHVLGYDWAPRFRADRIAEVLSQPGRRFTAGDFQRLQHDDLAVPARELIDLLVQAQGADAELKPWIERLAKWDRVVSKDSGVGALYMLWTDKLPAAAFRKRVPEALWPIVGDVLSTDNLLRHLKQPSPRWFGEDPRAGRDAALLSTLREAVAEARKRLGDDPATWRWGAIHHTSFRHPLAGRDRMFELPPFELGGDGETIHVTLGPDFTVNFGASFREVLDVADWDRSMATSVPGQSGQPLSPHYADLLPLWAEGRYFPLLFSRERIEAESKDRLVLEPVGRRP